MNTRWRVDLSGAFDRWWQRSSPRSEQRVAVLETLMQWSEHGPPAGAMAVPLEEDLYVVAGAGVFITFRAIVYERLVLVVSIEPVAR